VSQLFRKTSRKLAASEKEYIGGGEVVSAYFLFTLDFVAGSFVASGGNRRIRRFGKPDRDQPSD
jgi:hypothetical protein